MQHSRNRIQWTGSITKIMKRETGLIKALRELIFYFDFCIRCWHGQKIGLKVCVGRWTLFSIPNTGKKPLLSPSCINIPSHLSLRPFHPTCVLPHWYYLGIHYPSHMHVFIQDIGTLVHIVYFCPEILSIIQQLIFLPHSRFIVLWLQKHATSLHHSDLYSWWHSGPCSQ